MRKNWNAVGPVTVHDARRGGTDFDCLGDAVRFLGWRRVETLDYGDTPRWGQFLPEYGWAWIRDEITVWDECGMLVPVWRVREAALQCGVRAAWEAHVPSWRRRKPWEAYAFRSGPVPGTGNRRRWRRYRRVRTRQERAVAAAVPYDADLVAHRVKPRGRRSPAVLVDDRGDVRRGYQRSWKETRRTQWRE